MKPGVLTPSSTKYITADEALNFLGMASGAKLTESIVNTFIEDATAEINEAYGGSHFCSTTCVAEYYDAPGLDTQIFTRHFPIISVQSFYYRDSVTDNWSSELTSSLTELTDGYYIDNADAGEIKLWSPINSRYPRYGVAGDGFENVYKISYTFGYATIPGYVKTLCKKMVARQILLFQITNGSSVRCTDLHKDYRDTRSSLWKDINRQLLNIKNRRIAVSSF